MRAIRPTDEADSDTAADAKMIHSVSSSVVSRIIRLTAAIAIVTGSVSASCASGIDAASSRPALALERLGSVDRDRYRLAVGLAALDLGAGCSLALAGSLELGDGPRLV